MKNKSPELFILAVLVQCISPFAGAQSIPKIVKPALAERVKNCEYLDDVIGTSSAYGVFAAKGVENAREEALNKAASIGATHIVWQPATIGYGSTAASGKAFRCADTEAPK